MTFPTNHQQETTERRGPVFPLAGQGLFLGWGPKL